MPVKLFAWIDASAAFTVYYQPRIIHEGKPITRGFIVSPQVYWQVKPSSLHFVTKGDQTVAARMLTDIVFADDEGILQEDHFILETPPKPLQELSSINILEQRQYNIDNQIKGRVKLYMVITDLNDTSSRYRYVDSFEVAPDMKQPFFSGIKLLTAPDADRKQLPLCGNFLDESKRTLYYSLSLYNSKVIDAASYPVSVQIRINKGISDILVPGFARSDTFFNASQSRVVFNEKMLIGALASGNYNIAATLLDRNGAIIAAQSLFFQRMNLHPDQMETTAAPVAIKEVMKDTAMESVTVLNLDKTFLAKYTLLQVRAILKMLLPVSDGLQTNTINNFFKKPNEMYMKYYIYNHFKDINAKDPEKAWKEYSETVKLVNKKFTASGNAGYETDRGFIYLRYGKPTDIITVTGEVGSLPYEIWQYNVLTQFGNKKELANMFFLFYKQGQNLADYRLLHSTVPGEVNNYAWRNYLFISNGASSAGFSMNSRAEELIGNK